MIKLAGLRLFARKIYKDVGCIQRDLYRKAWLLNYKLRRFFEIYVRGYRKNRCEESVGELLFAMNTQSDLDKWVFHDERWNRIVHRWEHRRRIAAGFALDVSEQPQQPTGEVIPSDDGSIFFEGTDQKADKWFYLFLDPKRYNWRNYSWEFIIECDSCFTELQFGFRYHDFYNRYRYRFEGGYIYFDKVVKGGFLNALSSRLFAIENGQTYRVRIDVCGNNFRCFVDGCLILNDYDFDNLFEIGSIAIILWERDGDAVIRAKFGPMSVRKLSG